MFLIGKSRRRWFILAGIWLVIMILGVGGYAQQARANGTPMNPLDTLYQTLQLAALQFKGDTTNMNWRLQIVRFAAPLMAAGTLIQASSVVFAEQLRRWGAAGEKGHTVVVGSGEVARKFVAALRAAGHRVTAVTETSSGGPALRELRIPMVVGDPRDAATFRAARLDRASRLLLVDDDDGMNVDALQVAAGLPRPSNDPLRISVRLTDAGLAALLRGQDLASQGAARVDFVNLHDAGARRWLADHPLGDPLRPIVLGLGQLGRSLVLGIAQRWAADHLATEGPLPIVLVDRVASGRWHAMRWQHPAVAGALSPKLIDLDLASPTADAVDGLREVLAQWRPTWAAVVFQDESMAVSAALLLASGMDSPPEHFVVRTRRDGGLARVLGLATTGSRAEQDPNETNSRNRARPSHTLVPHHQSRSSTSRSGSDLGMGEVSVFPYLDLTCTVAVLDSGLREQLALALHEDYLSRTTSDSDLRRPWSELTDRQRASSRHQVDDLLSAFDAINCTLLPLRSWGAPATVLSETEIESMARREHGRWMADRLSAGWSYGPVRDNSAKRNPLLVPFDELPDDVREQNLQTARDLPDLLARTGFEPVRKPDPAGPATVQAGPDEPGVEPAKPDEPYAVAAGPDEPGVEPAKPDGPATGHTSPDQPVTQDAAPVEPTTAHPAPTETDPLQPTPSEPDERSVAVKPVPVRSTPASPTRPRSRRPAVNQKPKGSG